MNTTLKRNKKYQNLKMLTSSALVAAILTASLFTSQTKSYALKNDHITYEDVQDNNGLTLKASKNKIKKLTDSDKLIEPISTNSVRNSKIIIENFDQVTSENKILSNNIDDYDLPILKNKHDIDNNANEDDNNYESISTNNIISSNSISNNEVISISSNMLTSNTDQKNIDISYKDSTSSNKLVNTKENYEDEIKIYAQKYGFDKSLIIAMFTQERGTHSSQIDAGGGLGGMQIQVGAHPDGTSIPTTTFDNHGNPTNTDFTFYLAKYKTLDGN